MLNDVMIPYLLNWGLGAGLKLRNARSDNLQIELERYCREAEISILMREKNRNISKSQKSFKSKIFTLRKIHVICLIPVRENIPHTNVKKGKIANISHPEKLRSHHKNVDA